MFILLAGSSAVSTYELALDSVWASRLSVQEVKSGDALLTVDAPTVKDGNTLYENIPSTRFKQ